MSIDAEIVVVGAGAAGLMAAIWAGRTAQAAAKPLRIIALDGAARLGAKILVAGGGRCNVTHDTVDERAYAGSSPPAVRKVLRRFDVARTVAFFRELGVTLKREETGKLFPTTDRAATVLNALLTAARSAGVELRHPARVELIERCHNDSDPIADGHFKLTGPFGALIARRVILATGGKSLPKTGSDGGGYALALAMGHQLTPRIFPALVPLVLDASCFIRTLSGLTVPATIELHASTGKRLISFTDSTLCTHFGLSGPGVLDISRYYTAARADDPGASLHLNWMPGVTASALDTMLVEAAAKSGASAVSRLFADRLPQRLVKCLCEYAGVDPAITVSGLSRDRRRALVAAITSLRLPVTGDRGFAVAEVTAGGVPLKDVRLDTMESRIQPGLYFCGEICDVDGRIGGYNFQWAWASGHVAGSAAAESVLP